jgi:hypothetical protein
MYSSTLDIRSVNPTSRRSQDLRSNHRSMDSLFKTPSVVPTDRHGRACAPSPSGLQELLHSAVLLSSSAGHVLLPLPHWRLQVRRGQLAVTPWPDFSQAGGRTPRSKVSSSNCHSEPAGSRSLRAVHCDSDMATGMGAQGSLATIGGDGAPGACDPDAPATSGAAATQPSRCQSRRPRREPGP